jgi:hypothetical protein
VLTGDCSAAAIVQRRSTVHSQATATVPGRPTTWCHTVHERDVARRQGMTIPAIVEDIISYF